MVSAENIKELIQIEKKIPIAVNQSIAYNFQQVEENPKREDLLDTICHEIRNPLNGVYGSLHLLEEKIRKMEELFCKQLDKNKEETMEITSCMSETKEMLESLKQCAEQQKIIVDDVLTLSKIAHNKMELNNRPFNPKQVIQTVKQMFNPQLESKQLQWIVQLSDEHLWVKGDADRLTQIITNLVSNALKFTKKGHIKLTLEIQSLSGGLIDLRFAVADTGIGMTAEEMKRIFKKFGQANETISAQYGGTGLGLNICKDLVELMGGGIQVESEKGLGTVFRFNIRCMTLTEQEKLQVQTSSKTKQTSSKAKLPPKKLLVVDDNIINRKVATQLLDIDKHTIEQASNGREAIEKWEEAIKKGEKIDFILMDVHMPVMDGLEATKEIREKEKQLGLSPVFIIGVTGSVNDKSWENLRTAGMNNWIAKPYRKGDLDSIMCKLLESQNVSSINGLEQTKREIHSADNNDCMLIESKKRKVESDPQETDLTSTEGISFSGTSFSLFSSVSAAKRQVKARDKKDESLAPPSVFNPSPIN